MEVSANQPAGGQAPASTEGTQAPAGTTPAATSTTTTQVPQGTAPEGTTAPTYQPNYKFKFMDEEKEVDELFRPLIKDADSEKKVKDLFQKALGLDFQKPKYQKLQEDHTDVSTKFNNLDRSLTYLSQCVQNNDLGSFFSALKIPDATVFKYVQKRLAEMELPPEQQTALKEQSDLKHRAYFLEQQNQEMLERYQAEASQAREFQLDAVLAGADVAPIAAEFDARVGQPGAFKKEVIMFADLVAQQSNGQNDLTPKEAVTLLLGRVQKLMGPMGQVSSNPPAGDSENLSGQKGAASAPVIPNIPGRGTSPVKKGVRSIADLKQLAQSM